MHPDISGAQSLPNGNTIICVGTIGNFIEVTSAGTVVWKYVNPVINTVPLYYDDSILHNPVRPTETMNTVFRVQRYPPTYAGFIGKDMTPRAFIELYLVGIKEEVNNIPLNYELNQNFPNPFNPSTTIRYELPKSSFVSLKIYDVLGKEIETVVNENQTSGIFRVNWNAANFPSEAYFYKIQAVGYYKIIRMVLIKKFQMKEGISYSRSSRTAFLCE